MPGTPEDQELKAIQQLMSALEPLDRDARNRVIDYVFRRLGLGTRKVGHALEELATASLATPSTIAPPSVSPTALLDIRTLAEQKAPQLATERAAVVAYYLSELAPVENRKEEIKTADITKLFKQAGFPLPANPKMTLVHAKNAGYLDPGTGRGSYRLNPVGYNLVAHKLPASATGTRKAKKKGTKRRRAKRSAKKSATKRR